MGPNMPVTMTICVSLLTIILVIADPAPTTRTRMWSGTGVPTVVEILQRRVPQLFHERLVLSPFVFHVESVVGLEACSMPQLVDQRQGNDPQDASREAKHQRWPLSFLCDGSGGDGGGGGGDVVGVGICGGGSVGVGAVHLLKHQRAFQRQVPQQVSMTTLNPNDIFIMNFRKIRKKQR